MVMFSPSEKAPQVCNKCQYEKSHSTKIKARSKYAGNLVIKDLCDWGSFYLEKKY